MSDSAEVSNVERVFAILGELHHPTGPSKSIWRTSEFITLATSILTLIAAVVSDRTGYHNVTPWLVLLFLAIPVLFMLYSLYEMLRALIPVLGKPSKQMFGQAVKRVKLKESAIVKLREFHNRELSAAQHALAAELEGFEERTSLLVGVLEKTGMIPAAVALYLGYLQYRKNGQASEWVDLVFVAAFILYAIAFFGLAWKQSLKEKLWLLQQLTNDD